MVRRHVNPGCAQGGSQSDRIASQSILCRL